MISVLGDDDREVLVRDLRTLVRLGPRLGDLVVPSVAASGSNAGVTASVPGPRSPVREHPFAVEHECWLMLQRIVGAVCSASSLAAPRHRRPGPVPVAELAAWLLGHIEELASHEQAADAVVVVGQQARRVADLVEPPVSERERMRLADEDLAETENEWGTAPVLAQAVPLIRPGLTVSAKAIRNWADAGAVRSMLMPDGTRRVSMSDVLGMAEGKAGRVEQSKAVEG